MDKIRVLLAEDDLNLGSLLEQYLNAKGYETDLYTDGIKANKGFMTKKYDICLLDVMMPKKDGFELAKDIKAVDNQIPIIFLTAKTLKEDVLEGFKIGADDYLTKPFNMEELLFRIEAVMRRTNNKVVKIKDIHKIGKFTFDTKKQLLIDEKKTVKLTTKESELLKLLCENMNSMLERNFALKKIWRDDNYFNARSMDVYITRLRKHLKTDELVQIMNVHGKGYKLIISD